MGLRPLAGVPWVEVDDHFAADLARKRELLSSARDDVVGLVQDPDGRVAVACEELVAALDADPSVPAPVGPDRADEHPVVRAGLRTQEDWCVHLPDAGGRWRLVAACVCFPTRWRLRSKIGRTVREIHAPVPYYDDQLADPVDRYFDRIRPGVDEGAWRLNWNLLDSPVLHQPFDPGTTPGREVTAATAGERIWFRVERQTLVRLPGSGAVVFGIRVHVDRLDSLAADAGALDRLARSVRAMPEETRRDKDLLERGDAVLAWIDAHLP
jgi:hypothetical protein